MGIKNKFTYLNETKDLLKEEISRINVISDSDIFCSYKDKLHRGYIDILNNGTDTLWNNLEKVSQSGTEAVLEGVETAPMKMVLNGNTSQETTSGKNILPIQDGVADLNGVTLTIENGILTLNGTTTASGSFKLTNGIDTQNGGIPNANWLQEEAIENLNGKVLSFQNISGISPASSWAVRLFDNTTTYTRQYTYSQLSGDKLFDTDIRLGVMTIYLNANLTFDNFKVAIQIENGTNSTDFEKYTGGIPSPNPDYPQEVKVVKGENVVSVQSKNLAYDLTYHSRTNQFYSLVVASYSVVNGEYYAISVDTPNTDKKCYINTTINSKLTKISGTTVQTLDGTRKTWIVQATETATATNIGIISRNSPTDEVETGYLSNFMIEHISNSSGTSTPYVPYSKTDYPINLGTLELCKIGNYKDYFHKDSGKWYVHKEIGKGIYNLTRGGMAIGNRKWFFFNKPSDSIDFNTYNTNAITEVALIGDSQSTLDIFFSGNGGVALYAIVYSNTTTSPTLEELQEKVNGKSYYYVLATPTEEEITNTTLIEQLEAISKAKSVKDKTYITQTNDDLPFILDVEAIKEYEENLDNN